MIFQQKLLEFVLNPYLTLPYLTRVVPVSIAFMVLSITYNKQHCVNKIFYRIIRFPVNPRQVGVLLRNIPVGKRDMVYCCFYIADGGAYSISMGNAFWNVSKIQFFQIMQ